MDFADWLSEQKFGNADFNECLLRAWDAATKAEREACAKLCDKWADYWTHPGFEEKREVAEMCAEDIRMRSNVLAQGREAGLPA